MPTLSTYPACFCDFLKTKNILNLFLKLCGYCGNTFRMCYNKDMDNLFLTDRWTHFPSKHVLYHAVRVINYTVKKSVRSCLPYLYSIWNETHVTENAHYRIFIILVATTFIWWLLVCIKEKQYYRWYWRDLSPSHHKESINVFKNHLFLYTISIVSHCIMMSFFQLCAVGIVPYSGGI